jgi:cytochrome c oxidase subunit II
MTRTRSDLSKVVRLGSVTLAALSLAFLTGCQKFKQTFALDGPMSTRVTDGPVAQSQWDLFMVTVWVCTFIFIIVGAVLAYAQVKFHARNDADEHAEPPPQGHGNPLIEIGLIVASVALLVIIAIPTLKGIWYTHDVPEEERGNAMDVTAVGYQWWFRFEYNGEKVQLPNGGGEAPLVTGNELVVPAGVPVRVHLRTVDVIHSFWVPKLAGKVDMIPNRPNFLWFKATNPGYYYGQCAEYCGESHAIMRFRVIALSPSDYVRWLENQKAGARTATAAAIRAEENKVTVQFAALQTDVTKDTQPGSTLAASPQFDADPLAAWKAKQKADAGENAGLIAQGRKLFQEKTCVNCHSVRGHEGIGINGPDLTHVGSRTTIAAGVLENTPTRMAQWLKDPEYFKPGNKMYYGLGGMAGYVKLDPKTGEWVPNIQLNDQEIEALVAYLQSLK